MSDHKKVCEICGTKLTAWNRTFGTQKCTNCARGISLKQKQQEYYEFFRLSGVDENSIIRYSVLESLRIIFGAGLIILLGFVVGVFLVPSNLSAIAGMALAGWIARKMIYDGLYHPIDRKRYVTFVLVFFIVFWIAWLAWSWILEVVLLPNGVEVPLTVALLISPITAWISGIISVVATDKKYKSDMLRHFREWQQSRKNIQTLIPGHPEVDGLARQSQPRPEEIAPQNNGGQVLTGGNPCTETVERGFGLSAWLILVVTVNVITMCYWWNATGAPAHYSRGTGLSIEGYKMYATMKALFNIANIAGASAIWKWKKWGFWLLAASAAIDLVMSRAVGTSILISVLGLVSVAILVVLLAPKLKHLE
jgi:hypothetical protein